MRYVVVPGSRAGSGLLRPVDDRGSPVGPVEPVDDLAGAVLARDRAEHPRWV